MVETWNNELTSNPNAPQFQTGSTGCNISVRAGQDMGADWANWAFTYDGTGTLAGGNITVNSATAGSWDLAFSKGAMAHELGHGLGLDNATSENGCSTTNSVMFGYLTPGQPMACSPTSCDKNSVEDNVYPPPSPPPPPPDDPGDGCHFRGDCTEMPCLVGVPCDPIIIAVGPGSNYQLTSREGGVWFDLDADGIPDQIAWTRASDPIAFLVLDRNHNGIIDDGRELFGNHSVVPSGQPVATGFEALAHYDRVENGGNSDGVVDARDAIWAALQLWIDWNHNGYSEAGELYGPEDWQLKSVSLAFQTINRRDAYGNVFRLKAACQLGQKTRFAYDVFFSAKPQRRPD